MLQPVLYANAAAASVAAAATTNIQSATHHPLLKRNHKHKVIYVHLYFLVNEEQFISDVRPNYLLSLNTTMYDCRSTQPLSAAALHSNKVPQITDILVQHQTKYDASARPLIYLEDVV